MRDARSASIDTAKVRAELRNADAIQRAAVLLEDLPASPAGDPAPSIGAVIYDLMDAAILHLHGRPMRHKLRAAHRKLSLLIAATTPRKTG